jgi:aspartate carbamoyltransferase catalytic subunit
MLKRKDLISTKDLTREEAELILETTFGMKEILQREVKKVPSLKGKTVATLFFEPSTRTRTSFELAAKRLSADVVSFTAQASSMTKGETVRDTVKNIEAMIVDAFVIRHRSEGIPNFIAGITDASVINAGDGKHEHPTQALLDTFTILERKKKLEGLNIAIVGDITHSRVARSHMFLLPKLGANLIFVGPKTMIPKDIEKVEPRIKVAGRIEEVIEDLDVIIFLRIQLERIESPLISSLKEYHNHFVLNLTKLKRAKKDIIIMHPGPVNWGVELAPEIMNLENNVILEQVTNGVAVRMAILFLLLSSR